MSFTNRIESSFSFYNNELIGHDGTRYPPLPFKSEEHKELDYALKDPIQTAIIYSAYESHIEMTLAPEEQTLFLNALTSVCYLFGAKKHPPEQVLREALLNIGFDVDSWEASNPGVLPSFVEKANRSSVEIERAEEASDRVNVVITTTTASGGNFSVAKAMEAYLNTFGNKYHVRIVDSEQIAERCDPFRKATGLVTLDGIYYKVIQQENEFDRGFKLREDHKKVAAYIQSTEILELKREVASHKPHIILATRNFIPDELALCSLGVPVRVVYCDYEIGLFLAGIVGRTHPLIRCLMPSVKPRLFRFFLEFTKNQELYSESASLEETYRNVANVVGAPFDAIRKQYKLFGFPSRSEIFRIDDQDAIDQIREKWGVQPGEHCVPVVMGVNGVGTLESVFDQLSVYSRGLLPIKFIFVCGKNAELKARLEKKVSTINTRDGALCNCLIHGLASASEINELLNIASIQCSKPGGSTVGDVLRVGTPLFVMHQHPWEEVNGDELKDHGLAYYYKEEGRSLLSQIEVAILDFQMRHQGKKPQIELPDWKSNLDKILVKAKKKALD